MSWELIPGWFGLADAQAYARMARELPDGAKVAEIGCWMGRSLCALASFLDAEAKQFEITAVDTFKGTQAEPCRSHHAPVVAAHGGSVRAVFEQNTRARGLRPRILEMTSHEAARLFHVNELDAVYLDGSHAREDIRQDLSVWSPKVRPGGFVAGHDINLIAVLEEVTARFPQFSRYGDSWVATQS